MLGSLIQPWKAHQLLRHALADGQDFCRKVLLPGPGGIIATTAQFASVESSEDGGLVEHAIGIVDLRIAIGGERRALSPHGAYEFLTRRATKFLALVHQHVRHVTAAHRPGQSELRTHTLDALNLLT